MKNTKVKIVAGVISLAMALGGFLFWTTQTTFADDESTVLTGGSAVVNQSGTSSNISDLQVTSTEDNPDVSVKLFVSHGTISLATTSGLTFYNTNGTPRAGQPSNASELQFSGSLNDVNAGLATLSYIRTSGSGTDTLSASLIQPGEVFFSGNDHLYEYFPGPVTWAQAEANAAGLSKYGAQGYLATITSPEENSFIKDRLKSDSWIGAKDSATEGTWIWVTGPEINQQFWQGNGSGNTVGGMYAHWNNPKTGGSGAELNQSGDEDCAQFYYANNGLWNDLSCFNALGYIVEYGAPGDAPTVSSVDVSITTVSDATPPTTPGTPGATSPTTDKTPTVSWTASSDSGTGLNDPAYTLEWSTSQTFSSVSGSATTNSTSLAPSGDLADGTWYFRVKATDNSDNTALSAISDAVVIDTTPPTKPGTPVVSTPDNDNTPTYNWTASTDSGSGLAEIAYSVQWSQDTSFFGLGGQAGTTENSYTIPDYLPMTDSTWYFRVKAIDVLGHESDWSDYATVHIDTVAPIITNVASARGTITTRQNITWTTDKNTSSQVSYGPTSGLGTNTAAIDTSPRVKSHSVILNDLIPCSIYHYTVTSEDAAGNSATSTDKSFITAGCAGSAGVIGYATKPITTGSGGDIDFDNIRLNIPKNFAGAGANFQIKKINPLTALGAIGNPSGKVLAGTKVYDIKALQDGTTAISSFAKAITVTLSYSDSQIKELIESSLLIYRWDEGIGWTKLGSCSVNAGANTVTCITQHFSTFALYGEAKPADSSDSENSENSADTAALANPEDKSSSDNNDSSKSAAEPRPIAYNADDASAAAQESSGAQTSGNLSRFLWLVLSLAAVLGGWWILAAKRRRRQQPEPDSAG